MHWHWCWIALGVYFVIGFAVTVKRLISHYREHDMGCVGFYVLSFFFWFIPEEEDDDAPMFW